jgi:hypothetical protein
MSRGSTTPLNRQKIQVWCAILFLPIPLRRKGRVTHTHITITDFKSFKRQTDNCAELKIATNKFPSKNVC